MSVWETLEIPEKPTRLQRKALYRMGLSRKRVSLITRQQAAEIISVLVKDIPQDASNGIYGKERNDDERNDPQRD